MRYVVFWTQAAVEQLMQISLQQPRQPQRILITVAGFGRDGHGDVKKLEGSEEWRLRAGDWRIIFTRTPNTITVTRVANRRDAY